MTSRPAARATRSPSSARPRAGSDPFPPVRLAFVLFGFTLAVDVAWIALAAGLAVALVLAAAPRLVRRGDAPPEALPFRCMRAGGSYPARGARG